MISRYWSDFLTTFYSKDETEYEESIEKDLMVIGDGVLSRISDKGEKGAWREIMEEANILQSEHFWRRFVFKKFQK